MHLAGVCVCVCDHSSAHKMVDGGFFYRQGPHTQFLALIYVSFHCLVRFMQFVQFFPRSGWFLPPIHVYSSITVIYTGR